MRWGRMTSGSTRSVRTAVALVSILAITALGPSAEAYIDPGTGGAVFGSLVPILGMLAVFLLGMLGFGWTYARRAFSFLWRHRLWVVVTVLGVAVAIGGLVLVNREAGTQVVKRPGADRVSKRRRPRAGRQHDAGPATQALKQGDAQRLLVERHGGEKRRAERFRLFADDGFPEIERRKYELSAETRSCFVFDRDGSVEKEIVPEQSQRLAFCVAADFPGAARPHDSVQFVLSAIGQDGRQELLAGREWDKGLGESRWLPVSVDLKPYAGRPVTLRFEVVVRATRRRDGSGPVCLVSDPRLEGPQEPDRPNVVLFSIETLRRDHLGPYGYERKTSPFLEKLAEEAVVFEDAYAQSSWTRPSVASMLTGLYPSEHGAVTVLDRLDGSFVSVAEILRERGYVTAGFCTSRVISTPFFNYDQGFDLFVDEGVALGEKVRQDIAAWLDAEVPGRFFLFVHLFDPHAPYVAPGLFREKFDPDYDGSLKSLDVLFPRVLRKLPEVPARDRDYVMARYDGEILYADAVLGRLGQDLKRRGLWDNTLLLVTSDHGEEFNEHGGWGHMRDLYPEKLAVPLIIKLPGGAHGGLRVRGPASHVDIMPTLLSAMGVAAPEHLPGVDLLKSLENAGRTPRQYHFAEFSQARYETGEPIHCEILGVYHSAISEQYQYICRQEVAGTDPPEEQLFDVVADPLAQNNLADSSQDVLWQYAGLIHGRYGFRGYTIAVNGGGKTHRFSGTVRCEVPIIHIRGLRTEGDDSFVLDEDGTALRFELTVMNDDDALHFQTDPENAAVTVTIDRDGEGLSPEFVRLGPEKKPCGELPVRIPAERSAADADLGVTAKYAVGTEPGVFIWRQRISRRPEAKEAAPDEETIKSLKDLGYL